MREQLTWGKTTIIGKLAKKFRTKENGWKEIYRDPRLKPNSTDDFRILLEKDNKRVFINSRSDAPKPIRACKRLCDKYNKSDKPIDLLISSCRIDKGLKKYFFEYFGIKKSCSPLEYFLEKKDGFDELSVAKRNEYYDKEVEKICGVLKKEFKIDLK